MESGHLREIKEIEIAQLHLRYAHTRIERPKESLALAGSIECVGQIIPVIAVREGVILVLLDGYLRVKALRHCGRDTAVAEIWECKEEDALVEILARSHTLFSLLSPSQKAWAPSGMLFALRSPGKILIFNSFSV